MKLSTKTSLILLSDLVIASKMCLASIRPPLTLGDLILRNANELHKAMEKVLKFLDSKLYNQAENIQEGNEVSGSQCENDKL